MRILALLTAVIALGLTGTAHARTLVTFHKTGGFAGVDARLSVGTSGTAVIRTRGNDPVRHKLRARTLTRLKQLIADAHLEQPIDRTPTGCADCFAYRIHARGHTVSFDESRVPKRLGPLLSELGRLLNGGR